MGSELCACVVKLEPIITSTQNIDYGNSSDIYTRIDISIVHTSKSNN